MILHCDELKDSEEQVVLFTPLNNIQKYSTQIIMLQCVVGFFFLFFSLQYIGQNAYYVTFCSRAES